MSDDFSSADDFFSGGSPSISFKGEENFNKFKGGELVKIGERQQQLDYKTKKPEFWDDGKPKMVLPLELRTAERDPQDAHDDGVRTLWVGEGSAMKAAVGRALRETGSKLRPGGTLLIAWTSGAGESGDPKQYVAQWTPAAPGAAAADAMFAQPQGVSAPQYTGPQAVPTPQQPVAGGVGPAAGGMAPQQQSVWTPTPQAQPQQWPAQQPQAVAPVTQPQAVPAQPAAGQAFDLHAFVEAAYAHLSPEQRTAITAAGMDPTQIAAVFGPPSAAA